MTVLVFAAGVLVGFLAGITFNDALELMRSRVNHRPLGESMRGVFRWLEDHIRDFIVWVVILANLSLGVLLIQQRASSQDFVSCSARYNSAFAASYAARSKSAADVSTAMDSIVEAVSERDATKLRFAVMNYIKLRKQQDRERLRNPVQEAPSKVCGDLRS